MSEYMLVLKAEVAFYLCTKKNYIQQSFFQIIEKVIFLTGMIFMLTLSDAISAEDVVKVGFWFCLVNSFTEMATRIDSELRLKQYQHTDGAKTCYWIQCCIRLVPLLFESLCMIFLSFAFMMQMIEVAGTIELFDLSIYIVFALIQYVTLNLCLLCIALLYKRIQAMLDFVEFFLFFYSGMVMTGNSFPLFSWMNEVLSGTYTHVLLLMIMIMAEFCLLYLITRYTDHKIKLRGD